LSNSLRPAHGKPLLVLLLWITLLWRVAVVAAQEVAVAALVVLELEQHFPLPQERLTQ
jgi:hypothetical protein